MTKKQTTTDALRILDARYAAQDPQWEERVRRERERFTIGELIREARESRGFTQAHLARQAGTTQSAISRIEDADYEGLKVETLRRIALALRVPLAISLGEHRVTIEHR
ncbi:MAG: helix-turn-helix transcriptional regulator [Planctomycetes bacterium]|nr:helix-turn-helix transcriptional regulator [Planctomycetota bacterium]